MSSILMGNSSSNIRIIKNTLFLYFRTLFAITVGLYTSRVILQVLGVEDFGIYNVVGGIVMMFSFLNSGMVASSQRFISYELGKNNISHLRKVFSMSVSIHLILALLIFLLAETVGLWFLNFHMNIVPERMVAANWVYQCSVLAFMLTVISVPYNACIVAHEHMKAFAYIEILNTTLKLFIVLFLPLFPFDKLISYSVLLFIVALIIRLIYGFYCNKNFQECHYCLSKDRGLFLDMFSFAGWSFIGNLSFSVKDQGVNILINLFSGVVMNAARGIAYQVSSVVSGFMINLQMAMNPQITKYYAIGEINTMLRLVFCGSKYSFFLLMIIAVPLYIRAPYVLELWLKNVPDYTTIFLRLVLIMLLIDSMANPLVTAMQATGRIRNFQLIISLVMFANLPISYVLLKIGFEAYVVMYVAIVTSFIGLLVRLFLLRALILFSVWDYIKQVFLRNAIVCIVAGTISLLFSFYIVDDFGGLLLTCIISVLSSFITIYSLGLRTKERIYFKNYIKEKMKYK